MLTCVILGGACLGQVALACDAPEPVDDEARHALARRCAELNRADQALAHYEILSSQHPDNVDWLLGQAQMLVRLERAGEALAVAERARSLAPQYEDVWRVQLTALEQLGEYPAIDAFLVEAQQAFPESGWYARRRVSLREEWLLTEGTRVYLAGSYDSLSGNRPSWRALSAGIDRRLDERRRVHAGVHLEERFDTSDTQLSAAWVQRLTHGWTLAANGDLAPDAEVLPEWGLALEAGRPLTDFWAISLRARHVSYRTVEVDSLAAALERYIGSFRVSYGLTAAQPSGLGTSLGHVLRLAHDYGNRSHATLVVGFGEEAESIAPGVVLVTRVKSAGINGVHWTSAAWGISWEAGWHEQGDFYRRLRLRMGVEHRF